MATEVARHRPMLLKFALGQLRHPTWAEDAVSETVLAALARPQAFEQRSQLRTWLVGILKHKVIDQLRAHAREVCLAESADEDADPLDALTLKEDGHFQEIPADWGRPEHALSERQFFVVLEACVDKLPPAQGRAFMMREWLELSVEEICQELAVNPTHLYVLLHRARLRLRECLELNWFGQRPAKA